MYYSGIIESDTLNGEGIRVSLFVSGCSHHCKECFNPETWNQHYGSEFTQETKEKLFELVNRPYIDGLTLIGGDPLFCSNREMVTQIAKEFKERFKDKTIWLYTGYEYEEIKDLEMLNYIDVLVDGRFELDKRDITLAFRGSSNQRVIDIQKTKENNKVILYCE